MLTERKIKLKPSQSNNDSSYASAHSGGSRSSIILKSEREERDSGALAGAIGAL